MVESGPNFGAGEQLPHNYHPSETTTIMMTNCHRKIVKSFNLLNRRTNHNHQKHQKHLIHSVPLLFLIQLINFYLLSLTILYHPIEALQQLPNQNFLLPGHNLENIRVSETEPIDTIVHTLKAIDKFNENRRFSYHMTGDTFSVNEETGEIKLIKPLDRERQSQVVVVVSVFDVNDIKGDSPLESRRRTIIIEDVDDSKPIFAPHKLASPASMHLAGNAHANHILYQIDVDELTPVGSIVLGEVQVTDADEGINAEIVFECRPKHSTNFACDSFSIESRKISTGKYSLTIRTKSLLDYERFQSYRMSIWARGKRPSPLKGVPLEAEAIININVLNAQDEGPVFVNAPYSLSMPEGLKNGTRLLNMIVQDGDAAPQRELSMMVVPGPFSDYFQVSRDPELSRIWYLETNMTIDRENPLISDIGNMFTIHLLAAELDDESGLPVASQFELISAMREINYSKGTLRRESVTIVVQDLPDSRPIFVHASSGRPIKDNLLVLNISESLPTGSSVPNLDLFVQDLDQGVNSRFNLSLMDIDEEGSGSGMVSASEAFALESEIIYGKAQVVLNVLNSSLLDYEEPKFRQYRFNLVASKMNDPTAPLLIQILEVQLNVMDTNDNWPEFERDQFVVEIPEGAAPGTVLTTIKAKDRDSGNFGKVEYSLRGAGASKFKLVADEGRIIVADCGVSQCLDYESQPTFSLTYEAHDGGGKSKNVSLIINLIDFNDHRPRFSELIYKRELISDNLSQKQNYISPQLIVRAIDDDGPSQGRNNITYKLLRSNLTSLDVDAHSGLVYLSELVDLDNLINSSNNLNNNFKQVEHKQILFEAEVAAIDNGHPISQNSTARIWLTVKGNRDGAPQFKQDFYQAFVRENHPLNKPFYQVQAHDPDDKDSQLRYSLGYDLNDLLNINPLTGELSFKQKIDYDDFKGLPYNITVFATDNGKPYPLKASASVGIIIQDVNDKAPKFLESEYRVLIQQGRSRVGDVLLEMEAFDPDKNNQLVYSIISDQLTVTDRNGQQFNMDDLVNSTSGYLAHMGRSERQALAKNFKTLFKIKDKKIGQLELQSEPDYSFASSMSLLVKVQDLNQEIFTQNEIQQDFATCNFYFQTHVDKSPLFAPPWTIERRDYNLTMLEELSQGTQIFSLLATDPTTNSRIEMFEKVFDSDPRDLFHVSRNGLVTVNKRIDFEELPSNTKRLSISVKALTADGLYSSIANLQIQVVDLNDNAPQFISPTLAQYSVNISESAQWPQEILTVKADDKDSAQFGQVYYSLNSGSASSELFSIDPRKGILTIKKGAKLDRDSTGGQHSIQVIASDCDESTGANLAPNCKRSSILINVQLLDENDNDPTFVNVNKRNEFEALISETVAIGSIIAQAQAIDLDDGLNGQVNYEIYKSSSADSQQDLQLSKLFKINREGLISVVESLAGMGRAQPYKLTIRAFDSGKSQSRQSFAYLLLTISDVVDNDGIPKFLRPRADEVVELSESAGPNTLVYQIQAVDPDEEANGKIMYKFLTPSDVFDIDPFEGVIKTQNRLNFHLDRELVPNYTLIVVAHDLGSPPKSAQQILIIKISDINDNEPYFERAVSDPPLLLLVREEQQPSGNEDDLNANSKEQLVGTIRAVDKDTGTNALIGYEIIEGNSNNMFKLAFEPEGGGEQLSEGNNPCRIYSIGRLDREARESYTLTIRASSMSKIRNYASFMQHHQQQMKQSEGGKMFGSGHYSLYNASDLTKIRVTIKLLDINDNRPVFAQQNPKNIVDSSAEIYSQLMVFKAIDADSSSSEIQYSILDVLYYSDSKYKLLDDMYNGLQYQYHTSNRASAGQQSPGISMRYAFDIDPRSGILRNTISLRAFIDGYFEIFVKADSSGNSVNSISGRDELDLIAYSMTTSSTTSNSDRRLNERASFSCDSSAAEVNATGIPYADMESCDVAITRAIIFVTHQRETFRFVFNKTKLNDRLDEFKRKIQLALEDMMFEPSMQRSSLVEQPENNQLQMLASSAGSPSQQQQQQLQLTSGKANKIFLNTFNTEFYEREDGSLDFSTLTSCSQLVKFDDRQQQQGFGGRSMQNSDYQDFTRGGANQVISYEEVLSLLKTLNTTTSTSQTNNNSKQLNNNNNSLFAQYGLVNIERCPPDKTLYRMSLSEKVALYFAAMIALVGSLLALIVSNMRKNYERKLRLLQRSKYQIELMCGSVQNIRPLFY